jgi:hypothetical protein
MAYLAYSLKRRFAKPRVCDLLRMRRYRQTPHHQGKRSDQKFTQPHTQHPADPPEDTTTVIAQEARTFPLR